MKNREGHSRFVEKNAYFLALCNTKYVKNNVGPQTHKMNRPFSQGKATPSLLCDIICSKATLEVWLLQFCFDMQPIMSFSTNVTPYNLLDCKSPGVCPCKRVRFTCKTWFEYCSVFGWRWPGGVKQWMIEWLPCSQPSFLHYPHSTRTSGWKNACSSCYLKQGGAYGWIARLVQDMNRKGWLYYIILILYLLISDL